MADNEESFFPKYRGYRSPYFYLPWCLATQRDLHADSGISSAKISNEKDRLGQGWKEDDEAKLASEFLPFERVRVLRPTVSAWTCGILAAPHHHDRSDRPLKQEYNAFSSSSTTKRAFWSKRVFKTYHGHVNVASVQLEIDLLVNASLAFFMVVLTAQRHLGR